MSTKPTIKKQVKNGLRLGIGAGAFLIGAMFWGAGMERVVWSAIPPHHLVWLELAGWTELAVATALLLASATVWWQLIAGCMVLGFFKSIIVLITGTNIFPPHEAIPHVEALKLISFCMASVVLMWRFAKGRMTILDRIALTMFVFSFGWAVKNADLSLVTPGMGVGLGVLAVAWWLHQWASHKKKSAPRHPITTQSTPP